MPVNVAFGPSAGLVGQFGYKTGARQYSDQKEQIERQSKRQMLSDAMNFAKYVQDVRRPEEDQRRSLERMQEQQKLQKDTMKHQSAIRQTDHQWEQNQKDDRRVKQSDALIELDARLKREMSNLPADISPLERQQYYQRQYEVGAHRIGTAPAPGAEIKPYEHYTHKGVAYRVNQDKTITNVDAENAKMKEAQQQAAARIVGTMTTAKVAVETAAAKPFDDEITRLSGRRDEERRGYEGPASLDDAVPTPSKERFMDADGVLDQEKYDKALEKHAKTSANSKATYRAHHAELELIDKAILKAKKGRRRAVNLAEMKLFRSLGGEENLGGSMGGSLFGDSLREEQEIEKAEIEEAAEAAEMERITGEFKEAQRDPEAKQRFIDNPPAEIISATYSDFPHERSEAAAKLLDQGGPHPGLPFRLESGETVSDLTMRGVRGNQNLRHIYSDKITDKDIARYEKQYEQKNPKVDTVVPHPETGKPTKVKLTKEQGAAVKQSWAAREKYEGLKATSLRNAAKPKNKDIKADFENHAKVVGELAEMEEDRHKQLVEGMGDTLEKATALTPRPKNLKYQNLLVEEKRLRDILDKENAGTLAGEKYQQGLAKFRAARTHEAIDEPHHPLLHFGPAFPKETPLGWFQRKLQKRAGDLASVWDVLTEMEPPPGERPGISETGQPPKKRVRPQTGPGAFYDPSEFGT
jgi:hypothetical protein